MSSEASLPLRSPAGATTERPRRVNRSCTLCTQRKVKCDGGYPCRSCERHKSAHLCAYRQRTKRQVVSRSNHQQLLDQLQTYADIVERAFPGMSLEQLTGKDASELSRLTGRQQPSHGAQSSLPLPPLQPPPGPGQVIHQRPTPSDQSVEETVDEEDDSDSENDEAAPERAWDESVQQQTAAGTDDNNGVNVITDDPRSRPSYLGATSNNAVFRAIFRLNPAAKQYVIERTRTWNPAPASSMLTSPSAYAPANSLTGDAFSILKHQRYVDFYFEAFHPITPILHEESFRASFQAGRQDVSWLGLLYIVLALGSIASGSNTLHDEYYYKAKACLNFETLGAGNIESLQALCLLGGFYLNFRNSPNMAFAIRGAAHRMAIALGLHREARRSSAASTPSEAIHALSRVEFHRRIWWSLFCLDTWLNISLGRPTCGRWDTNTMDVRLPASFHPEDYAGIVLRASCDFCFICTRIQDRFAQLHSPLTIKEALAFDAELAHWYAALPPILLPSRETPRRLLIARQFMRHRYYIVRLLLLRSILFRLASSRVKRQLTPDETTTLNLCRTVTVEAVDAIARYWTPDLVNVWSSAWTLFQICLAPLLCITVNKTLWQAESAENLAEWSGCLVKAVATFKELRPWMRSTDRTPDIVEAFFEAVMIENEAPATTVTPTMFEGDLTYMGWGEQWGFGADFDWNVLHPDFNMGQAVGMNMNLNMNMNMNMNMPPS